MTRRCTDCPLPEATKVSSIWPKGKRPLIAFVAEAPGETEQEKGVPLVGKSGQLLRRIVTDLGVDDSTLYYGNTCMCKPPGNKKPTAAMVRACYDGLMDELEEVKPKLIVTLGNVSADAIGQYKRGVKTIRGEYRQVDLDGTVVGLLPTYHPAAILRNPDLFRDLEFDLRRAVGIAKDGEPPFIEPPVDNYTIVEDVETLRDVLDDMEANANVIAMDLETISRDFMDGYIQDLGMSWKRETAVSVAWSLFEDNKPERIRMKRIMKTKKCSFQEASFDIPWLRFRGYHPNLVFDTAIAHWLIDERMGGHDLDSMATQFYRAPAYKQQFRKRFGIPPYVNDEQEFAALWAKIPDHARRVYNATDADYTFRLTHDLKDELKRQNMLKLNNLLVRATMLYADLFLEGMCIDTDYMDKLEVRFRKEAEAATKVIEEIAPHVNPRSPKQLAAYLYDELGLDAFGVSTEKNNPVSEDTISSSIQTVKDPEAREYWQTARIALYEGAGTKDEGRGLHSRSTSTFMLYWLAQQHEYPRALIRYKKAQKSIKTYIEGMRKHIWRDGRIRPDYKLNGTLHGRFKSKNPAIHNLTADPKVGLYDMFTAPPGFLIVHADYSQADMRMMAHFSGDDRLAAWLKGDPHTEVVKEIGHFTDEQIKAMPRDDLKKRRMAAKMVNFGLPYGRSAANLAPQMGMSVMEAQEYIRAYWRRLPKLKAWMDRREAELMASDQELTSPFGNKRRFPLIIDRSHRRECARLAVNFPIMSSVNYLTTLAHIRVVDELRSRGIDTKVYPHIHDSINVCVPEDVVDEVVPVIAKIMERIPEYINVDLEEIQFPVEITAGFRWGEAQRIEVYKNEEQTPYEEARRKAMA